MAEPRSAELIFVVSDDDTAIALGSGDVPVLATPRLLAWCEAATVAAVGGTSSGGDTSVGTRVTLEHLKASPVGARVLVRAEMTYGDGRYVRFAVTAHDGGDAERLVATAEVTRVVVNRERFLARLPRS
ncbi:thioesterase family protein [Spongisporangium articulatum]|uniref:Thioesterase family protein n=1 Tax=Spongisporangium articulatum TaxID=3362603 RepID=A0ABW8APS6_9ACTN